MCIRDREFEYEQQRTDRPRAEPEWAMGKEPEQTYTNEKKTGHGVHKNTAFELKIGTYSAMTMGEDGHNDVHDRVSRQPFRGRQTYTATYDTTWNT
eukprot:3174368-Pyramimonas_sp.AAC.1